MAHHNQFIITPETCVDDMLYGVQATYPGLSVDVKSRVIFQAQDSLNSGRKVGLLSGGGSGHEPFAAGYVGEGMLTAAVAGSVFAAPPASHILTAVCNVADVSPGGVLVILNNYTGDILNFGLAVERAKAKGYNVNSVIIDEDCAIDKPEGAGKRGLCGCLFVLKIAGGMSLMGKTLKDISSECALVKKHIVTLGVTVRACNMPGLGLMFHIEDGSMEVGVGIHGEAGASRRQMLSAEKIVEFILEKLSKTLNVKEGDKVCTIVNNLGGSSQLELFFGGWSSQCSVKKKRRRGSATIRGYADDISGHGWCTSELVTAAGW
uniref:DhaK domain-containing protein n=1 Tax=Graphocephala atropunctata TaxID=36148 RepID=A0A1B6MSX1_9HEMI